MAPAVFLVATTLLGPAAQLQDVDMEINRQVWKQRYGVLDAQMAGQPPYLGWLEQDADGDGVNNSTEFTAGTNPFNKLPGEARFQSPAVTANPTTLSLTFPTVVGKFYGVESNISLVDAWSKGSLPDVAGDGTPKTLTVPKSAGHFFRLSVTDQATQGDQVSDWAKHLLGLSTASPIGSQTSFDHASLAASLQTQNLVSLAAVDTIATQPADSVAASPDPGLIQITRSGFMLLSPVTVPISKGGTAVEGIDYEPLPSAVTFPAGVNSLDLKITPRFNPGRTSGGTVFLGAASPGSAGAAGNYTLGSPASAGVTIYPPANPAGSGLTANYYSGASPTYASPLNFGGIAATYNYTMTDTTSGSAVVTYSGTPTTPYVVGAQVKLQFTSGSLNTSPSNSLATYMIVAPVTTTTFAVGITGTSVPATGSGNLVIGGFNGPITRLEPTVDFNWGQGAPDGNGYINADNYSVIWDGWLSPSTSGNYVFRLDADDKARVLIDTGGGLQQILENGWDTPPTGGYKLSSPIALTIPASATDRYPIRVEFVETTGAAKCMFHWQINGGSFVSIPAANIYTDNTGSTISWNAAYYNNPSFTPPVTRTQTAWAVNYGNGGDWLTGSPDPSIFHNYWSAKWTGQILPKYTQTYYFVTRADEGVKLWIDHQLIVDRWPGGLVTDSTGSINLQAGVFYDITMEYYDNTWNAEAHLSWYSEDQAKQIIPTNRLFPTISGTTPRSGDPPAAQPAITSPTSAVAILGSGSPFNMILAGSNGGTFSASGLPLWLTLTNGVVSGTPPAAGIYQFTIITTNAAGSGSAVITLQVLAAANQLTRELWTTGVTGAGLSNIPWASVPTSSDTISAAEDDTTTYAADTGERLRGYFTAPATGNYYFWIAASNTAELWISNNAEPVNKVRRASVTGPTGSARRTWNAQPNQQSRWLSLVAGNKYYIEALHNTGASGAGNHLSIAWFLDPTGTTANPLANGSPPAPAATGGVMPSMVISPWDNPPTTTVPGTLYVTNLQGVQSLGNIIATGGAFLRVNGTTAVLQLNYAGLTSGAISRRIYNSSGQVIFNIDAQDKNYPALITSDGGHTWNMQQSDLAALNNGEVYLGITTVDHPDGEIAGTFGKISGSQTAPAVPDYPAWADLHASSDAANSRFLSQATFGPSPADMASVKANGYRTWIENQLTIPSTRNLPYLAKLGNDPQNPYGSWLFFNSWWKNSVTAPDQLRQRAAFALSEILVVSDTGPLNNNGLALAGYYDMLLDSCFGNFRDILKQVTLSPAMGAYLDLRGNAAGSIQTGLHPNENYAREIMQLFSVGLYHMWPDGSLVLDSTASAVPTYAQNCITGMARVFTGWTWGQPLAGDRLPTSFTPPRNDLDPMVLVPTKHEPGTKILLDNVVLPAATVTTQSDTSTDPASTYTVQSTDPTLGAGNLVTTTITNKYDLGGIRDLEVALDNILNHSATGPHICRQLIQRLVTSHPKPDYVHRVVRAFNGQQNVDGIATGVRGDMKEVFRAILLDWEARAAAAADSQYGKQREPLLRITGPARAFPATGFPGSTYRELGLQPMLITTPAPHRLANGDTVLLDTFVDSGALSGRIPSPQSYVVANTTPAYSLDGPTGIVTITAPGYQAGDTVALQFTSGSLATTSPFGAVQNYPVVSASTANFTVNIGDTTFLGTISGTCSTPDNFTVNNNGLASPTYNSTGDIVTITASGYVAGHQLYLKFSSGGLLGAGYDGIYTIASATGTNFTVTLGSAPSNTSGIVLIPRLIGRYAVTSSGSVSSISFLTSVNHNLNVGDQVQINFLIPVSGTPAQSVVYTVAGVGGPNEFNVTTPTAISNGALDISGMAAYPLAISTWTRAGTVTVNLGTWNIGNESGLGQVPLNAASVFNFFYPDYRHPGQMALAGMTTPEFQLTNESNTVTLTNLITWSILSGGNPNGYTSFHNGGGSIVMDLGSYMTPGQTADSAIPALVDSLGVLLAGGNVSSAARTSITDYVTSTGNFPYTTPTARQMSDRVRAVLQLIVTSAEYAIQK